MSVTCRFDDFDAGRAFTLSDPGSVIVARSVDEIDSALAAVDRSLDRGGFVAGFLAYEAAPAFDPALVVAERSGTDRLPLAWFGVFSGREEVPLVEPPDRRIDTAWTFEWDRDRYDAAFSEVGSALVDGWTYEVNLTTRIQARSPVDPELLYRQLAHAQRGAHLGYLATDEFAVACGSPELFFAVEGGVVTTRPMKGTAPRGRFEAEDERRAAELAGSDKERAENLMIVDLLRNDLGRIAPSGGVRTTSMFDLERYPTVWQLTSTVEADVAVDGLAPIFRALFPCGSVTGAPKASTMAIIARLERRPRGVYCGAFGWAVGTPEGVRASFAVPIRTAVIDRVGRCTSYGVGGAIVVDSTAEAEWAELVTKAAVLTEPTAQPPLLETLRFDPEKGYVNLARHLRRLEFSADRLGHRFDLRSVTAAVSGLEPGDAPARVRIILEPDGAVRAEASPLDPDANEPLRLGIASAPVDRGDRRLFSKTTDRERYDAYLAGVVGDFDDVVLWNAEGEVTETTRANLLVEIDREWWTPPLECGLLPGIGRGVLLEEGSVAERVITISELASATSLGIVSSLRGRRSAVLSAAAVIPTAGAPGGRR